MLPSLPTCHAISKNVFKLSVAQFLPVSVLLVKNGHFYNVILAWNRHNFLLGCPIELKSTWLCSYLSALSLDTHNRHIVLAGGHGHIWPFWPYDDKRAISKLRHLTTAELFICEYACTRNERLQVKNEADLKSLF